MLPNNNEKFNYEHAESLKKVKRYALRNVCLPIFYFMKIVIHLLPIDHSGIPL